MTYGKIDIGNVRGIQGDKGEKGERGRTPSYDDLRYQKQDDEFITIKGVGEFTQTEYYLDVNGNLCNSEGYIYDENGNLTDEIGEPFNETIYGYKYQPLWKDSEGNYTNNKGELLDENWNVQYVKSDFIGDIATYIFEDKEGYDKLVGDVYPHIVDTLVSADPNDEKYSDFFDELEGDIKYYICADNPKTSIYLDSNNEVVNTCKYYDENGVVVKDENYNPLYVLLEKNTLYLYNDSGLEDNDIMHYDVYLCTKFGTIPKKIISSADFSIDYNVIDDFNLTVSDENHDDENEVWLNILTRGTRGQFYSMSDVDTLFNNNVISKLGANNGIAQLNGSGKVPSTQLPAYIDDVVEGSMNSSETTFTPSDNDYIDSVKQKGKIYVDTNSRKTYRWTGSKYIFISNPIVVDDDSTEAFASVSGKALETKMGNSTLTTTDKTVTGAINEHESDIISLNNSKQNKNDNSLSTTNKTVVGAINEHEEDISNLNDVKQNKSDNSLSTTNKTVVGAINENTSNISSLTSDKQDKTDNSLNTSDKTIVGAINSLNSDKQNKNDNSLNTTDKTVVGAINEHESDVASLNSNKQDKTDNSLTTTAKTIVGAINEHETDISSLNTNKQNKSDNALTTSNKTITGAINELNSALDDFVTFDNMEEILDELVSETVVVSSKNPIVMTGDSTQLIARIYGDYDGNQTIQFYEKIDSGNDVLLSTSTTNNGVAYYNFTGNGTGERKFYAKWGSFQSETYELLDCLYIDNCTSDDHANWNNTSGFTWADNKCTITVSSSSFNRINTAISGDFEATFKASVTGGVRLAMYNVNNTSQQRAWNMINTSERFYKIKRVGSSWTAQESTDGANWTNLQERTDDTDLTTEDVYFGFVIATSSERSITYSDLKVYPI